MSRDGVAPGPLLLLGAAALALAFAVDAPVIIGALCAGALALFFLGGRRPARLYLIGGAISGIGLFILNPFVTADGDTIIVSGPPLPIIDTEITVQELISGLVAGARVFAVAVLVGALLAHIDPDRLLALVSRLAPRSALICALSARLLPVLERDARAIGETARLRGLDLAAGSRRSRVRGAVPLVLPLLGSGLERGLDIAEAMAARGYGGATRTRLPEARWRPGERLLAALGAALAGLTALALATGAGDYVFYPTLSGPAGPAPLAVAAAALAALVTATIALRR